MRSLPASVGSDLISASEPAAMIGLNFRNADPHPVVARLALSAIISGLRVGTSLLVIAVVQSKMLSATDGLGVWISYHRSLFNVGQVYFGVGLVLAAALNTQLGALERRLRFHL